MSEGSDARRVLEARAQALARPRATAREAHAGRTIYATFERGGVVYAIDPAFVVRAAHVLEPTALPRAPGHWRGVTSLHGELLAVFDLPRLLGDDAPPLPEGVVEGDARGDPEPARVLVLVLGAVRAELAIVVDAVGEARALADALALTPPTDGTTARLVLGTTPDGVRILLADALLGDPRLRIEATTTSEA